MVHTFKCNGNCLVYDSESGALLKVDETVYALLCGGRPEGPEADEALAEIEELKREGVLYASPNPCKSVVKSKEIKSLCVHISHDCNLRCGYCFADEGAYHGKREYMSVEVGRAAIDFLIARSGKRHNLEMDFFGGEPLMNYDVLKDMVEYGKERAKEAGKEFKFTVTTNGLLLDDEKIEYLDREMDNVVMSLDGRREINDAVRKTSNGKGSFDLIADKFRRFAEKRGEKSHYLRGTFTSLNPDFSKDVLYMADMGFEQISVEPVVLPADHPLAIKEEQLPVVLKEYEILAQEYVKRRKNGKWFSFFHFALDLDGGPCFKKRITGCGAGSEYMAVAPNGDIYPCHQFVGEKEYLIGNVKSGILDEGIRDRISRSTVFTKKECEDCWAKYLCSGGCNANAVHFSGDINRPYAMACEMMKKRLECAMWVKAEEAEEN